MYCPINSNQNQQLLQSASVSGAPRSVCKSDYINQKEKVMRKHLVPSGDGYTTVQDYAVAQFPTMLPFPVIQGQSS
ncbi:hypothetical protein BgiBS90_033104, partial [Biomphalaria glabrata]